MRIRHELFFNQIRSEVDLGRGLSRWINERPGDDAALDPLLRAAGRNCGVVILRRERIALAQSVDWLTAFRQIGVFHALYADGQCDVGVELIQGAPESVGQAERQLVASKRFLPVLPVWFLFDGWDSRPKESLGDANEARKTRNGE